MTCTRPIIDSPTIVRRLSGSVLSLLLLTTPVLAHGGHGDEFQGDSQAAQSGKAIQVDAETANRMGLKVEPVKRQRLAFGVQTTGQIETLPSKKVEVTNPTGGTVVRLYVQPGDEVNEGQPVALLSSPELAQLRTGSLEKRAEAEGNVQQAQADLQLAQENYAQQQKLAAADRQQAKIALNFAQERYDKDQELAARGALPSRQVLESETKLAEARSALVKTESGFPVIEANAQLKRAQSAVAVAESRINLSSATYTARLKQLGATANPDGTITVVAPIAGVVADREVTLGQSAQDAGAKLMTIVDGQTVLATANVYEKDLAQVAKGQRVRVTVAGLPNQTFTGRITVVNSVVQGETRVVPVKAELDNSSGRLKPGMFATLELITEQTPAAVLAIPKTAIAEANGKPVVYIQNGKNFEPADVVLGRTAGDLVEVKSGVFEGDQVVTQGAPMLYAQSLRGGSKPGADHPEAPAKANITSGLLPWWVMVPVGGAIAAGTFFASTYWANRRHRQQLASVIAGESYPSDDFGNGHNSSTAFSAESHRPETTQPSSVPESHQHH
jgi:membrane fusion protein, heavy metal efflux system